MSKAAKFRIMGQRRALSATLLGVRDPWTYVAIPDPYAGRARMYTLWRLMLGGGGCCALGRSVVIGREIPLSHCRRLAKEGK